MVYGGFWIRVGAYLIDGIILFIAQSIIFAVFGISIFGASTLAPGSEDALATGAGLMANLISIVMGWLYFSVLESGAWQATLGKKALGLVVTDTSGSRISFGRATGRYFGKILSSLILLIGFIMVAFTERKQGLHDMIASTLVVKGEPGMVGTDPDVFS